jgi:putative membrane protein
MKNPHLLRSGIVVIAMAVATAIAAEQKSGVSSADEKFAKSAAIGGMLEVKLGEVAEKNASSKTVKDFGSMMVTDHTKLNDELKSLAAKQGITLPAALDSAHQAVLDKFSKLNGAAFDKAYITDMVKDHQKDLAEFKAEAAKTKDPELKAFAEKGVSVISTHLEHAKSAEASLK